MEKWIVVINLRIYILSNHTAADKGVDFIAFKVPPAKFQFIIGQVKKYRLTIRHFAQELWKITNCDAYWFISESLEAQMSTNLQNQAWYKDLPYAQLQLFEKKDLFDLLTKASDSQIHEIAEQINNLVQRDLQQIRKRLEVTKESIRD
ncbi:MAG: hypothetical protein ACFFBD_16660 [Candidatus Hodarchaeota archaeon]